MLNGKFVCVKGFNGMMTKGKIYDFTDGKTMLDCGVETNTYLDEVSWNNINGDYTVIKSCNAQPKDLLQMGRIVKHKNDAWGFVLKESILYPHGLNLISIFDDNLATNGGRYDIVEIYEATEMSCFDVCEKVKNIGKLLWKREEKTPQQIEIEEIEKKQRELAEKQKKLADRIAQINNIK